jgi:hypothetical protein
VDKTYPASATSTVNSSGVDRVAPPVVVDAGGKAYTCNACSGDKITLGAPATGPPPPVSGHVDPIGNQDIIVLNPGRGATVTGNNNTVTGGSGNNRDVQTIGSGNTITLGDGSNNKATATGGGNNNVTIGNGDNNSATTDVGNRNTATTGTGNNNRATTSGGNNNQATTGAGSHNQATAAFGNNNTASAGDGNHNRVLTGAGNNDRAAAGNGNDNQVTAGRGDANTAMVGNGDRNRVVTGAGNGNAATAGNGNGNQITAGQGSRNTAQVGNGDRNRVVTGAGNDNLASAGNGNGNEITAGRGSGNSAMVGDGNHNRVVTGAGNDNLATAGDGQENTVIAGGPGNRNVAIAGDGERNHAEVGQGNDNLAAVGAGRDNFTRTGAGNDNATINGPGAGSRTQVGPGSGNMANNNPVDPKNYRPFTPRDPPVDLSPRVPPGQGQNGNQQGANQAGATQSGAQPVEPLISPYAKSVESGVQNFLGKYNRYQRTLRDAVTRHLIASDQMRSLANSVGDSSVPGAKQLARALDRYGNYRAGQAQWYGARSQRLAEISGQKLSNTSVGDWFKRNITTVRDPKTGVFIQGRVGRMGITNVGLQGHLPTDGSDPMRVGWRKALPTQRLMSSTLADRLNRSTTPNPRILNSPAVQAAQEAHPGLPVTTNIDNVGGMRLLETARRGLTKVAAPVGLALGALDVVNQVHHGVPVGQAVGKTASGILVSGAVSAGTTALLGTAAAAAIVPGPGWAIAGGIVAGVAASYVWDAIGGSKLGAKVGGWVGNRAADVGKGIKNTAVNAWHATSNFFGGIAHAFG